MSDYKLADRMNGLEESATLALNAKANAMAKHGQTVYNLTAGELASDTPEYIQEAVKSRLSLNKYTPVAGMPQLREIIADESRAYYELDWIKLENVVVTGGVKPALFACFQVLLNPGDEVIIPIPAWTVTYHPLIELAGGSAVDVPLKADFDLDVEAIAAKISPKTKAIIINSPQNPTGSTYSVQGLKELAALLKGRGICVISDDIYHKLIYVDDYAVPAKSGFENLIIVNGFSKSQSITGWRIGYMIADEVIASAATNLLSHVTANAPLPSQLAGLEAMKRQDRPPESTLHALRRQRQVAIDGISAIPGLKCNKPTGAFYLFIDIREVTGNSATWCERLLNEAGVALVPGEAFGTPGFARLTYTQNEDLLGEAVEQIRKFVEAEKKP